MSQPKQLAARAKLLINISRDHWEHFSDKRQGTRWDNFMTDAHA